MRSEINKLYAFAGFRFDGKRGKLWRDRELILLSPKETELLALLLEYNGEYVSKEEIFEKVWADTFVEDGVLTQNIYLLRKTLTNHSHDGQNLIENRTRLGYRLTVPIEVSISDPELSRAQEIEEKVANEEAVDNTENAVIDKLISPPPARRTWKRFFAVAAVVGILLTTSGFLAWRFYRPQIVSFFRKPIESVKFTQLTNTGNLSNATLSPDGTSLAFARGDKIFLKDLVSGREIPLEIPNIERFSGLQFSSDGNFLYFCDSSERYGTARILKTSRFGGDTNVVIDKAYGSFSLSRDNKFLAYYDNEKSDVVRLIIRNLETKEEKPIFDGLMAGMFRAEIAPVWSPDGQKIIHINQWWGSLVAQIFVIDVETGASEELKLQRLRRLGQAAWFPDGKSFVISASEDGRYFHLWKISYPDGDAQALTVGLTSYNQPVISADGKKIQALQSVVNSNLFVADAENLNEQKPLTTGNSNRYAQMSLIWADDKRIVFASQPESEPVENLWLTDVEGRSPKQITKETRFSANTPSSDGRFVYYNINRNRFPNINRISLDGENLSELTNGADGARRAPQVSPDGNWLYYVFLDAKGSKILRLNLSDQTEEVFLDDEKAQCGVFLALSPDGKYLACFNSRKNQTLSEKYTAEIAVISTEDKSVKFIMVNGNRNPLRFSPDNKAVEYLVSHENGVQIMRHGFDDKEPKPILQMPKDHIFNFAWSRDGKKLALSRGQQYRDAVLLSEFDK